MRIVFDTNILVSEILAEGLCREIVEIHVPDHTPILSSRLWEELVEALEEKFVLKPDSLPLLRLYLRLGLSQANSTRQSAETRMMTGSWPLP